MLNDIYTDQMDPDIKAIAARYETVLARIENACERTGRLSGEVTLVAVSKTFPVSFIEALYDAGHRHFGENRAQELREKTAYFSSGNERRDIVWHMIGHLQRNKARDVVDVADLFHALDSPRLAVELDRRAGLAGRNLPCLAQVNISGEESKFGVQPGDMPSFLESLESLEHLEIRGLMAMAGQVAVAEDVRGDFRRVSDIAEGYRSQLTDPTRFDVLSMGMSQDYEVAIEEGATHVRLGSAIFGARACMIG